METAQDTRAAAAMPFLCETGDCRPCGQSLYSAIVKFAALTRARRALSLVRTELVTDLTPWDSLRTALPSRTGVPCFVWESPDGDSVAGLGVAAASWSRAGAGAGRFDEAKEFARGLLQDGVDGVTERDLRFVSGFAFDPTDCGPGLPNGATWLPERTWIRERGSPLAVVSWQRQAESEPLAVSPFDKPPAVPNSTTLARDWNTSEWDHAVKEALRRIGRGELEKVVLARSCVIEQKHPWDPTIVFEALRVGYPESFRYFVDDGNGRVFLGASPERLVSLREGRIEADAVAGTARGEGDPIRDSCVAQALLSDPKERREHEIVVREILASLSGRSQGAQAPVEPSIEWYRHLLHLRTRIRATALPGAHVLDLVSQLHPTPAVAGSPSEAALEFLRAHEPRSRGWYAGPIGWMDGAGNGDFTVGLRSALLEGNRALLLAGAGIVLGSDPEREWKECEGKMGCLEDVLSRA